MSVFSCCLLCYKGKEVCGRGMIVRSPGKRQSLSCFWSEKLKVSNENLDTCGILDAFMISHYWSHCLQNEYAIKIFWLIACIVYLWFLWFVTMWISSISFSGWMAPLAEQASKLLDFNQKLDINLLDNIVGCMYSGVGEQVYIFEHSCIFKPLIDAPEK